MIDRTRRARRTPRVEPLEPRALLAAAPQGMWPLPDPGPATSVFVRFAATVTPSERSVDLAAVRATVARSYADGPDLVTLGLGIDPSAAILRLQADPGVVYAAADRTIHAESVPVIPNDPAFGQLSGLSAANNVDIDAPEAWGISTGNPATIVAVVDTGIDLNNPDFAGKIWTNPVNDAAQGYPNDLHGWNFVAGNNNLQDDNGHGSHVSGIIAAAGNNNYGVVGVDWNARLMPLKFLDSNGTGSTDLAVAAIYYAVDHGARVINASWGGVDYSAPLFDAINYANAHNVVFVTAAGNTGTNNDLIPSYPASFRLPNELSVAAVDSKGNLPSFSDFGPGTVDIAAPGVNIVSDVPTAFSPNGLQTLSGTSMSTAYVSGVAALVAGIDPQFTAAQIVQRVDASAKPLPGLAGKVISGGIVDAFNALAPDAARIASGVAPAGGTVLVPGVSSDADIRSTILASDEFLAVHGGTAAGFVTGLYVDLLGRYPDPAGLGQWVGLYHSGSATRFQVAEAILTSFEGRLTEVARLYQHDLGRTTTLDALKADPGVAAWAGLLANGVGDNTVEAAIMASPEYLIGHGGSPPPVISGLYNDLDDRAPSATEQTNWAGLLWEGNAPFVVLRYFQGTPEARVTKVARWFVEDLGRPTPVATLKADPGVLGWAAILGYA